VSNLKIENCAFFFIFFHFFSRGSAFVAVLIGFLAHFSNLQYQGKNEG